MIVCSSEDAISLFKFTFLPSRVYPSLVIILVDPLLENCFLFSKYSANSVSILLLF